MLIAGIDVGKVTLHHIIHELLEGDFRHPPKLLLRLGAVTLRDARVFERVTIQPTKHVYSMFS